MTSRKKVGEREMRDENKKKISIGASITLALIVGMLVVTNIPSNNYSPNGEMKEEIEWQDVYVWTATGENDPGADTGGFLSCFLLDYGEVPETVLANNATDWSASGDVHAYADSDAWSEDAISEDPFYVVVRARFTQGQAMSGGAWNGSRTRCTVTATGDETFTTCIWGNDTAETMGGGIESENNSGYTYLYMNFYFDDNSDGYRLLDDGDLVISSIVIEAKY